MAITHAYTSTKADPADSTIIGKTKWNALHTDLVNVVSKSSAYTMGTAATDELCLVTGTTTITLPTAVGCTGKVYSVKRLGTGNVTVATTGVQTIDGAADVTLGEQYDTVTVVSDGTNWDILRAAGTSGGLPSGYGDVDGMEAQIQLRRGTTEAWTEANPTLATGEISYETDSLLLKIGDGSTDWVTLPHWNPFASVPESDLELTDVTTANSSIDQHGLLPKLSGDRTQFLDGTGIWHQILDAQNGYVDSCEFMESTGLAPFSTLAIGSGGVLTSLNGDTNHPGVMGLYSGTSYGGGRSIYVKNNSLRLSGGEFSEIVFRPDVLTDTTAYMGFHSSTSAVAPTDGCYLNIAGTTLTGRNRLASAETVTGTSYTMTATTWYRARIEVNAACTRVDYTLYLCSDGRVLWTNYIEDNFPTATIGYAINMWSTVSSSVLTMSIDYVSIIINRLFVR